MPSISYRMPVPTRYRAFAQHITLNGSVFLDQRSAELAEDALIDAGERVERERVHNDYLVTVYPGEGASHGIERLWETLSKLTRQTLDPESGWRYGLQPTPEALNLVANRLFAEIAPDPEWEFKIPNGWSVADFSLGDVTAESPFNLYFSVSLELRADSDG